MHNYLLFSFPLPSILWGPQRSICWPCSGRTQRLGTTGLNELTVYEVIKLEPFQYWCLSLRGATVNGRFWNKSFTLVDFQTGRHDQSSVFPLPLVWTLDSSVFSLFNLKNPKFQSQFGAWTWRERWKETWESHSENLEHYVMLATPHPLSFLRSIWVLIGSSPRGL